MAIKGSLKEASLPDVLQLLALGQKTGCLSIADRSNFGYIYFDKGRICYASIVNRRDRLGDILAVDKDRLAISESTMTETQQRLLPLLNGSRDIHHLIEDSGLGEFEVGKALYGLITAGFLHRAGRTASAEDARMTDARVEEHRNLGVAFYKTGMLDEAAREFRRVAELRAGDANALFYIGLVALKQARWREAMEALRLAAEKGGSRPAVLHNLAFAYEQLGRLDEAEAAYGEAAARARTDPRVYLGLGVAALKRGDLASAGGRLDRARELFGDKIPAVWYWARALTFAAAG